jgi:hypothetical protein
MNNDFKYLKYKYDDDSLTYYLEQSKILFFSRKLLNRWCRTSKLPKTKYKVIPYLFKLEAKAYGNLKTLYPNEVFDEILWRFEGAVCVNWNKYIRILMYHYLRRN